MNPPLAKELRKLLLWLTLACLTIENIDELIGLVNSLQNEDGRGLTQVGMASKVFAHGTTTEPPLKISCIRHW